MAKFPALKSNSQAHRRSARATAKPGPEHLGKAGRPEDNILKSFNLFLLSLIKRRRARYSEVALGGLLRKPPHFAWSPEIIVSLPARHAAP